MVYTKKSYRELCSSERGSGGVIALILLVIVALVGAMVFMSKNVNDAQNGETKTASSSSDEGENASVDNPNENPVIARVYGEEITRQDVIDLVNVMPPQMRQFPLEQLFPMALEQLINNKIVDKNAANAGLENDEFVKEQLKQAKEQIIRTKYLEDAVKAKITDERLQEEYKKYIANFPEVEEVKASHILVDDEKIAKDIIAKLNKGEDFAKLAKEYSKDGSSENGGELGYFSEKEVVPEFAKAAFETKIGEYTKKPVKSNFGYHIIKVEDKRKRPPAEFAQAKPYLEKELQRIVLDEMVKDWRENAEIERFDINGKPITEQEPAAGEADENAPITEEAVEVEVETETENGAEESK